MSATWKRAAAVVVVDVRSLAKSGLLLVSLACAACSSDPERTPGTRADGGSNSGNDTGIVTDGGPLVDAGIVDAGNADAGPADTGFTPPAAASATDLEAYVRKFAGEFAPRNYGNPQNLDRAAAYIKAEFERMGIATEEQPYTAGDGQTYRNIIGRLGPTTGKRIIIGAHYDAFGTFPGADDNASGVAGLLEVAKLLSGEDLGLGVELVAYSLEEPPTFRTADMGSAVHAASVNSQDIMVAIVLETIGYYTNDADSQEYPLAALAQLYGTTGNFLAVVGRQSDEPAIDKLDVAMSAASDLVVNPLAAPPSVTGIDFSDHLNYWDNGMTAVMLTDTAFYRNDRYHTAQDTPDTLDYARIANVVDGVKAGVLALIQSPL